MRHTRMLTIAGFLVCATCLRAQPIDPNEVPPPKAAEGEGDEPAPGKVGTLRTAASAFESADKLNMGKFEKGDKQFTSKSREGSYYDEWDLPVDRGVTYEIDFTLSNPGEIFVYDGKKLLHHGATVYSDLDPTETLTQSTTFRVGSKKTGKFRVIVTTKAANRKDFYSISVVEVKAGPFDR